MRAGLRSGQPNQEKWFASWFGRNIDVGLNRIAARGWLSAAVETLVVCADDPRCLASAIEQNPDLYMKLVVWVVCGRRKVERRRLVASAKKFGDEKFKQVAFGWQHFGGDSRARKKKLVCRRAVEKFPKPLRIWTN
jgi:hypothetical protein